MKEGMIANPNPMYQILFLGQSNEKPSSPNVPRSMIAIWATGGTKRRSNHHRLESSADPHIRCARLSNEKNPSMHAQPLAKNTIMAITSKSPRYPLPFLLKFPILLLRHFPPPLRSHLLKDGEPRNFADPLVFGSLSLLPKKRRYPDN